jgi:hypothetical protein
MFRRLDSVFVFKWHLLSWAQLIELVPTSGPGFFRKNKMMDNVQLQKSFISHERTRKKARVYVCSNTVFHYPLSEIYECLE